VRLHTKPLSDAVPEKITTTARRPLNISDCGTQKNPATVTVFALRFRLKE
jgi:hypothetical protein